MRHFRIALFGLALFILGVAATRLGKVPLLQRISPTKSSGGLPMLSKRPCPVHGKSTSLRFSPAQTNFAQISSATMRASGPIKRLMLAGVRRQRSGSNFLGNHPHSWQSRKKNRIA